MPCRNLCFRIQFNRWRMENQGLSRVSRHIENGTATAVPLFLCLAPPCRQHEQHADDAEDQAHPQHGVGAAPVDGVPRQEVAEHGPQAVGGSLHLTHLEFFTLAYLARRPGWVFTQEQIYEAVWHEFPEHCGAAVANIISQLRRKMGPGNPIRTVPHSGYKFELPP